MESYFLEANELSPEIILDPLQGKYSIIGRSIPSNHKLVYDGPVNWLNDNLPLLENPISLEIKLDYFNTSSHKRLVEIIILLSEAELDHEIIWVYDEYDEDLQEIGNQLASLSGMNFNFVQIAE